MSKTFEHGQIFEGRYPKEILEFLYANHGDYRLVKLSEGSESPALWRLEKKPAPTQKELLAQAKVARAAAVAALTVEVDGMTFDGDEKAQERMARAVLMAESPEESMEWVLADSSVAIVTAEQLRRACRAAGKAMGALWVKPYTS